MLNEYVYGVGEIEEMDDMLCLFVTKRSHWENNHCMDDAFYSDVDDALGEHSIYAEAENMYAYYDPEKDDVCLSPEDLKTIANEIGLVYDRKFENYVAIENDDDWDEDI